MTGSKCPCVHVDQVVAGTVLHRHRVQAAALSARLPLEANSLILITPPLLSVAAAGCEDKHLWMDVFERPSKTRRVNATNHLLCWCVCTLSLPSAFPFCSGAAALPEGPREGGGLTEHQGGHPNLYPFLFHGSSALSPSALRLSMHYH